MTSEQTRGRKRTRIQQMKTKHEHTVYIHIQREFDGSTYVSEW